MFNFALNVFDADFTGTIASFPHRAVNHITIRYFSVVIVAARNGLRLLVTSITEVQFDSARRVAAPLVQQPSLGILEAVFALYN